MTTNSTIRNAVRLALASSAAATAMYGVAAVAQDAAPQDDAADVGTIVVTGSRIKSANLEATTPVTQVTSEDVVTQGVTRIEDLVNQLPQAFAAQNVTVANGATGTATLDLRGLGSPRTLVLIDGRRMPYGGVTNSAADINQIPASMVERVDILTGGASAVYGSDAVADWPILNALVNAVNGASWVSFHHGGGVGIGYSLHAGQVIVADGTPEAARRLERVLTSDPAMGVLRHVDAGYDEAREVAKARGVKVPGVTV